MDRPHLRRLRVGALVATAALALAACSGGGGGGGDVAVVGGAAPAGASTQTLAWQPASGPVAGYRVWMQPAGGSFDIVGDVPDARVTLRGEPGATARIAVAAFDDAGNVGALSPPSAFFTFPDPTTAAAAQAAITDAAVASAQARSFAASSRGTSDATSTDVASAPIVPPADKSAWDASGNLVADLLWEAGGALRVTTPLMETEVIFARPHPDDVVAAVGDFDGDGLADPLWVGAQGDVGFTPMAALRADGSTTPVVALGTLGASERVVAAGDFDGDGLSDVLLQDANDDFVSMWLSNRGAPPDEAGLGAVTDTVVGVADYDGDGSDDILWQTSTGSLVVWQMAGALTRSVVEVTLPAGAEVLASGDFDGDGAADVAQRDPATGVVSILRPLVGAVEGWTSDLGDTRGWSPLGAADFDGDGTADLLLGQDGALRIAYLPGEDVLPLDPASPWSLVPLPR